MPATRRQATQQSDSRMKAAGKHVPEKEAPMSQNKKQSGPEKTEEPAGIAGSKRNVDEAADGREEAVQVNRPVPKKVKKEYLTNNNVEQHRTQKKLYQSGTIERGHVYFLYRPKVQLEEAHSLGDVQRFYILLVPRPPAFSTTSTASSKTKQEQDEDSEMKSMAPGTDAVPALVSTNHQKPFRLIAVGKKRLPEEDLRKLEQGLGGRNCETKMGGESIFDDGE